MMTISIPRFISKSFLGFIMVNDSHIHNTKLQYDKNLSAGIQIYSYSIPGDPIPLQRARHGRSRTWNPQKQIMLNLQFLLQHQHGQRSLLTGPLHLEALFYFEPARSLSQKKKDLLYGTYHFIKPDGSNLLKFIEDLGTGIIYIDDCLIASSSYKKIYDRTPRTEFSLHKL